MKIQLLTDHFLYFEVLAIDDCLPPSITSNHFQRVDCIKIIEQELKEKKEIVLHYCLQQQPIMVDALAEGSILFTDDIISHYPGLNGGRIWKEPPDRLLLQAVMRHGYEMWQAILDDKDLKIQEVICEELNLDVTNSNTPAPGAPAFINKEMQGRQVEFIEERVMLLENGLLAELQKEYYTTMNSQTPQVEIKISPAKTVAFACDKTCITWIWTRLVMRLAG